MHTPPAAVRSEEKQHAARFERVKAEFQQAIEDVDLWAHPYHTCCRSRAALSCLQYNEGSGCAARLVFTALDLEPNRLQQQLWDHRAAHKAKKPSSAGTDKVHLCLHLMYRGGHGTSLSFISQERPKKRRAEGPLTII